MENIKRIDEKTIEVDGIVYKAEKKDDKIQHGFEKYSRYWCILGGKICEYIWIGCEEDENLLSIGNAFHTKEEAEFALEKLKVIHELKQFTEPKNTVWDFNEYHYVICYDCTSKAIDYNYAIINKYLDITFATEEMARKAVETVGKDRIKKYYFGVEES